MGWSSNLPAFACCHWFQRFLNMLDPWKLRFLFEKEAKQRRSTKVVLEKFQMQIVKKRKTVRSLQASDKLNQVQLVRVFCAGRRWKKWHFVEVWMWVKHRPKNAQNPSLELGEFLKFGDAKALQWAVPASNECYIFPWANLSSVLSWKKSISYISSMFISGDGQQERWTWRTNEGLEVYQSRNS